MAEYRKNLANVVVDTMTASTTATTIPLVSGYGATLPDVPYFMTFTPPGQLSTMGNSEIVLVSARTVDSLTVVRAQKGTTARSIATGWLASASILRESTMAVGDIVMTMNTVPQNGRIFMDGGTYNKSTYPLLYDHVLNNAGYGTTTSTTFTLKDMRGRVPVGKAASGTFATLAATGGTETETLTTAQIPSHFHDRGTLQVYANAGAAQNTATNLDDFAGSGGPIYGTHQQVGGMEGQTGNTGGGGSHNNLQPYIVTNYEVITG